VTPASTPSTSPAATPWPRREALKHERLGVRPDVAEAHLVFVRAGGGHDARSHRQR
jgi:hypothetical protein